MTAEEIKAVVDHVYAHGEFNAPTINCKHCPVKERCDNFLTQGIAGTTDYVPLCEKAMHVSLEYTKEHYPHVLTFDEALSSDDPVYFEAYGRVYFWGYGHLLDSLQFAEVIKFGECGGVLYDVDF